MKKKRIGNLNTGNNDIQSGYGIEIDIEKCAMLIMRKGQRQTIIIMKESEKIDNTLDFARKLIKLWNVKLTVIPIVSGTLGTVLKNLERRRLDEESRPSKPQHYWGQLEFLEDSWRPEETCCHANSSERSC